MTDCRTASTQGPPQPQRSANMDLTARDDSPEDAARQAGAEDHDEEITPEMIQAGASVLYGFETQTADEAFWAAEVYRAMRRAAQSSG